MIACWGLASSPAKLAALGFMVRARLWLMAAPWLLARCVTSSEVAIKPFAQWDVKPHISYIDVGRV